MSDKIWNSADGVYTTGFAGAALASADRGMFPADNLVGVTSGHTAQNAVDAALIWFQEGYNPDIGTSGGELYTSWGVLRFEGGGKLFVKAGDNECNKTIIKARPATSSIVSATLNGTGTTDYEHIVVQRGNVAIGANIAAVTSLTIMPEATVAMAAGSTVTLLEMLGGTFNNSSTITTAHVHGGTLNQATAIIATELKVKGGRVNIVFGGTYPLINQYGGHINMTASSQVKIVTAWNIYGGTYEINELTTATINDYR